MRTNKLPWNINPQIIAESGGTKTQWIQLSKSELITTTSCHPIHWNESFWQQQKEALEKTMTPLAGKLLFFGAGCYREPFQHQAVQALTEMGFQEVVVLSDLHAAGYATLGNQSGWCAIAGTGSVLFHYSNGAITEIIGGKGHLEGDEGSAYYFGKMYIQQAEDNTSYDLQNKLEVAQLALKFTSEQYESLHRDNIKSFCQTHLTEEIKQLHLVGSYAHAKQNIWNEELANHGVELKSVIRYPLPEIVRRITE